MSGSHGIRETSRPSSADAPTTRVSLAFRGWTLGTLPLLLTMACAGGEPLARPAAPPPPVVPTARPRSTAIPGPHATSSAPDHGRSQARGPAPQEVVLRGYRVSDDDGSRAAKLEREHARAWVETANAVFRSAGIRFRLEPAQGLLPLPNSLVNRAMPDREVRQLDAAVKPLLERHRGEVVVLFRHGPAKDPTAVAFSGLFVDYVVMPGFEGTHHCGHDQRDALAHELGHYFGLPHTFVQTVATRAAAEQLFRAKGRDRSAFDGDGFEDTPPDPAIVPMECSEVQAVELDGVRFQLPRDNLMSYYRQRNRLSPQQRERVRWVLAERLRTGMAIAFNRPEQPVQAEALAAIGRAPCRVQSMVSFRRGRWSGDQQRFCTGPASFRLWVPAQGRYEIRLYATRAPDFGQLQVELDGAALGSPFEAWAPVVLPSGPIVLALRDLERGAHQLDFRVVGRHPQATADKYGIDALELVATRPARSVHGAP